MLENFKIDTIIRDDLVILGINIEIVKQEINTISSIFNSNISKKRYLKREGFKCNYEINFYDLSEDQIKNIFLPLNGLDIDIFEDVNDIDSFSVIAEITPFKHKQLNFFDSINIKLKSPETFYQTDQGKVSTSPITSSDNEGNNFYFILNDGVDGEDSKIWKYNK